MNPVETFQSLLNVDRNSARVLTAGLAVIAAAAIAASWKIDLNTAFIVGLIILALGVLLTFVSFIIGDAILQRLIAWAVTIFIFVVTGTFFVSASFSGQTYINPVECLVRFWERCDDVRDDVAERNAPDLEVKPISEPVSSFKKSQYMVWIQFAGYKREDIIQVATALSKAGWEVPYSERGGERLESANAKAEVRYRGQDEKKAAELLAAEISETGIKDDVVTSQNSDIRPNTLEVWIGL